MKKLLEKDVNKRISAKKALEELKRIFSNMNMCE